MGGASSSAQDVVGLEHYAKWTLPYVRSAFDRAQAYRLRSTDTFIRLSRFQFWEVRGCWCLLRMRSQWLQHCDNASRTRRYSLTTRTKSEKNRTYGCRCLCSACSRLTSILAKCLNTLMQWKCV